MELLNRRTTVLSLEPPDNGPRTFQTASFFDPASPRQITVPFDGFYDIGAKINFAGDPDGVGIRRVSVNRIRGGQTTRYSLARFAPPSTARSVSVIDGGEAIIPAEAGDRFQVAGHQSSGGKLNAVVSSFEITYLGPPQSALVAPPQGPIATGP